VGVIGLAYLEPGRTFGEAELAALERFAQLASVSLENARLYSETRAALAEAEIAYEAAARLNQAAGAEDLLKVVSDYAREQGATSGELAYFDLDADGYPEWAEIEAGWTAGVTRADGGALESKPRRPGEGERFNLRGAPRARFWLASPDKVTLIDDVNAEMDAAAREYLEARGIKAVALIPLHLLGRWVGVIEFGWSEAHRFTARDERVLTTLGQHASAVANARRSFERLQSLLGETRRLAERQQTVARITDRMHASAEVKSIMQVMAEELRQATGSSRAVVRLSKYVTSRQVDHE
jgi:GAF domain-containing protein